MIRSVCTRFAMVLFLFASLSGMLATTAQGAGLHAAPDSTNIPMAARTANGVHSLGVVPNPGALHPAAPIKPIGLPTPLPVLPSGPVTAPGSYPLQASASTVTVKWSDRSDNELGFKVFRRDTSGNWQLAHQVATSDVRGTGTDYTWVDTSTDLSGQCYMITAYNANDLADTAEECTVRPDPSRFPLLVPYAQEWSGLSDTNDGTGALLNLDNNQQLRYADQTFGVNLTYGNSSLWRIEAQGGPHLMKGQAVALKVWGGGWLKYGYETFGVDLQLSSTPVYEWYAIGRRNDASDSSWAGTDLEDGGSFALWNSSAHAYLLASYQTWGVSLNWSNKVGGSSSPPPSPSPTQQGVKTEQVFNCATDQFGDPQPVEVWIEDRTAGSGFVDEGTLDAQWTPDGVGCPAEGSVPLTFSPLSGHQYLLVATDSTLAACDAGNDPTDGQCQAMDVTFEGAAIGCTRTDVVGGRTMIACPAARKK